MRNRINPVLLRLSAFLLFVSLGTWANAQVRKISGKVTDEANAPIIGAIVKVPETTIGTGTDLDGFYTINVPEGKSSLEFSFLGYNTQVVEITGNTVNVQLLPKDLRLSDVVVVGYGTQRKKDLTGSISNVSSKDFNDGLISSPEQLINGKVSGVQIMSNSGSPTSGSSIRIRGGASLNASNDPLIVLDGVPLETGGISGNSGNFLSLINPSDIESMSILKDAASTAIYGSRASNGVIIITTKKGQGDKLKVTLTTTNSIQNRTRTANMLSRDEFINGINLRGTSAQKALLQNENTNWNDQVFQNAFGTDNNLSISGRVAPNWPIRASLGYYNQEGILKSDKAERFTGNVSLTPSFLNDRLRLTLSAKGAYNNNNFANTAAIWSAATSNPTIPVYSGNDTFGGYTEGIDNSGQPVNGSVPNPLGLIEQNQSKSSVKRIIGNADVDYRMFFLNELRFHATLGYDYAQGQGSVYIPAEAAELFTTQGRDYQYGPQTNMNQLFTSYFNYNKDFSDINSTIDATVGYDYQFWKNSTVPYSEYNTLGQVQTTYAPTDYRHALISYYARVNYSYDSRYLLTLTARRDGTSRFSKENRWGTFPSVALAWRVNDEAFMKNIKSINELKLRASYGVTGQQDGIGNYNYLPIYTISQDGAQMRFGDQWYYSYRPKSYIENLKWETTNSWNMGLDLGLFDNRLSFNVDYYTRKTKDLLATVPSPAGSNFDKTVLTNVGNIDSQGLELTINATPVETEDFSWNASFNMTWQKMTVKNLSSVAGGAITNTLVGPAVDGYQMQVLTEGYAPYMFYVYHQLYDEKTGLPVEGAYADTNNDGQIDSDDLYRYHSPAPDFIMGFTSAFRYKKWTLNMGFRANIGNYVYNGMAMNTGAWSTVSYNAYQLNNLNSSYLKTNFQNRQYLSDYYVENASFLKMDNLSLGYNFGRINKLVGINVSAMVQNVFTLTKYSGVDPEVPNGMDMSFYPRPRIYSINVGFDF